MLNTARLCRVLHTGFQSGGSCVLCISCGWRIEGHAFESTACKQTSSSISTAAASCIHSRISPPARSAPAKSATAVCRESRGIDWPSHLTVLCSRCSIKITAPSRNDRVTCCPDCLRQCHRLSLGPCKPAKMLHCWYALSSPLHMP